MYCTNCGAKCSERAQFCAHCGQRLTDAGASNGNEFKEHISATPQTVAETKDAPSFGYKALGFFLPVVGLVLYLVWREQTPLRAKSAGKGALLGAITLVILSVIGIVLSIALPIIIFRKNIEKNLEDINKHSVEDISGADATGIIAMIHEQSDKDVFYETVISIDPDTGKVHRIAKFPISEKEANSQIKLADTTGYGNLRHLFSADFSKRIIIRKSSKEQNAYVGWIDARGNYLDIWETAFGAIKEGAFGNSMPDSMLPKIQYDPTGFTGFTLDEKLTFKLGNSWAYVSLNPNNLHEKATVRTDPKDDDFPAEIAPEQWDKRDIYAIFDVADNKAVTDWLDETKCLVDKYREKDLMAMCDSSNRNTLIYDAASQMATEYIPETYKSRNNWSGVASPDGEKIAFLSNTINDNTVKLCITSQNGGKPVELDLKAPDELKLRLEKETDTHKAIYCTLLDWK